MHAAIWGIVVRDLSRSRRQRSRLVGGLARPFMWLLLVGGGYNAIARIDGVASYQAFVFPGIIVMAMFFGAMLTAIRTGVSAGGRGKTLAGGLKPPNLEMNVSPTTRKGLGERSSCSR